ncbi:PilZ domain-containing protein [Blastomonas sp.]|uniref:PilZ domain-containing protein n=1 Tax=Blastomonas sp. TaxID=1909299 RepID=UPI0026378974|nr:PilZ domain-containing protein [Blastomonas sp.]MDM7956873.1 PilZ domain-containing protein [Blastomonas sp.]
MSFGKKGLPETGVSQTDADAGAMPEREARVHRLMKVTIFHERFGSADAVIRDISSGGLGGRCTAMLTQGDVIDIDRPGLGRFEAEVRWVRNGQFGAQLTSDLRIDTKAIENLAFNGSSWDSQVNKPLENHVFTRFRPMQNTYRPGISPSRRGR